MWRGDKNLCSLLSQIQFLKLKISKNNSRYWKNKKKSPEHIKRISETKKLKFKHGIYIHPMLGKKHSNETRKKMSEKRKKFRYTEEQKKQLSIIRCHKKPSNAKRWKVISPEGKEIIVFGLREFCRKNNLSQSHMFNVAKGNGKHHKNWKCEYFNGDKNDNN